MSLLLYFVGGLLRVLMGLFSVPFALLNGVLSLPVLSTVWGVWVWFCGLFGDAGDIPLSLSRFVVAAAIAYVPLYVLRHFTLRRQPIIR